MLASLPKRTKAGADDLLAWYDRHRRDLPWRARPGEQADPYRVWISEIMLQQTTVAAVRPYYHRFLERFPDVRSLAAAPAEAVMQAWAGLGYYSRARNLHACAQVVVREHGGRFPTTAAALLNLPGVGAYTAGAIAAIAFDEPAAAIDGNVERVIARLHAIEEGLPAAKRAIRAHAVELLPHDRPGDFAQALMDLGATVCTPRRPACALCPWRDPCQARAAGRQEDFPRKSAKREGALRCGAAFVALRADDAVLLRTRPPRGLLGGTAEVPTSAWRADYDQREALADAPLSAPWREMPEPVRHVFTHFPLQLAVFRAETSNAAVAPPGMRWTPLAQLSDEPLSSLMKKVIGQALDGRPGADGPRRRAR